MAKRTKLLVLLLVGSIFAGMYQYRPRAINEGSLAAQLSGSHCRFSYDADQCKQRGFEPFRSLLIEDHDCDMWAVQCLMGFNTPRAGQVMINVLRSKTDVETCDGVRPIRTYAVKYLGDSGDRSAIPPLKELLQSSPTVKLSVGASGCQPQPESVDGIRAAISKLEGQ